MRTIACWIAVGVCGALALGCGSSSPTTSTITGTLDQASFPAAVAQISVVDDQGVTAVTPVEAGGAFELTLTQGATYRFLLSTDGKSLPIVVKSDAGRLQTEVTITSGGASADIGSVRYWAGAGSVGQAKSNLVTAPAVPSTTPAACVNGVIDGTTQPCASGEAAAVCAVADQGGCPNMGSGDHGGPDGAANGAGTPVVQPAAISTANDAADTDPVAVPEHNLPSALGCASSMGGGHHGHHHH
jgi:hypothetical protein